MGGEDEDTGTSTSGGGGGGGGAVPLCIVCEDEDEGDETGYMFAAALAVVGGAEVGSGPGIDLDCFVRMYGESPVGEGCWGWGGSCGQVRGTVDDLGCGSASEASMSSRLRKTSLPAWAKKARSWRWKNPLVDPCLSSGRSAGRGAGKSAMSSWPVGGAGYFRDADEESWVRLSSGGGERVGGDEGRGRLTSERAGREGAPEGGRVDGRRGRWGGGPVIGDGTEVERRHDFGMGKGDEASSLAFMDRRRNYYNNLQNSGLPV